MHAQATKTPPATIQTRVWTAQTNVAMSQTGVEKVQTGFGHIKIGTNPAQPAHRASRIAGWLRAACVLAAAAWATAGAVDPANACLMWDISRDPQHRALGESYLVGGSALQNTGGGVMSLAVYSTAFANPLRSSVSFLWNDGEGGCWALGSYHSYMNMAEAYPISHVTVSTGPNFNTQPGITMNVTALIPYTPFYRNPSQPDLALYHLSAEIPGARPAVFGTISGTGELLTHPGFGMYGATGTLPATGVFPRDGNVRACRAHVDNLLNFGFTGQYYSQTSNDAAVNDPYPYAGRSLSGYSGSPVFNAQGQLVGITVAGSAGTFFYGATVFERLGPTELAWIHATATIAPAPSCDSIDFNADGLFPDDADLLEFLTVLAGGECTTGTCNDIDFNNDGLFPDDADLLAFLTVLAGGNC